LTPILPCEDIELNDEWITEEGDVIDIEQTQGEYNGENVHLNGVTRDSTLDALDLDKCQHRSLISILGRV